jgi:eukaryotic-like serine/threonine-protein kinase
MYMSIHLSMYPIRFTHVKIRPNYRPSLLACLFNLTFNINYAQAQKESVSMFRDGPQLDGVTHEHPIYKLNRIKFQCHLGGPIRSMPAIANGLLYLGCGDSYFYAIDSKTGQVRWRFKTAGEVYSSPATFGVAVYFTSRGGNLYALNSHNGKKLWSLQTGKDIGNENYWDNYVSSPVIAKGNLYFGSGNGYLYAINLSSGKLLWKYNAGARIRTTPAISGDHVIFGANSGVLFDINRTNGHKQWQFDTDGASIPFEKLDNDHRSIFCSASVHDGIAVMGGRDGIVYGINVTTGKEIWRNDHKDAGGRHPWILSTAINNGTVFVGSGSDYLLQALDLKTGKEKWRFKAASSIFSSITIASNMIYFNDVSPLGYFYCLNAITGAKMWQFPVGSRSFSTPVISNGVAYCSGENGLLYAIQGVTVPSTAPAESRNVVYWEKRKDESNDSYFLNWVEDYTMNYFVDVAGYELVDKQQLEEVMNEQLNKKSRSVIVFATNKFPQNITEEKSSKPLIRKYLDSGGKVVLLGINPIGYKTDTAGNIKGFDQDIVGKLFDIKYVGKKFTRGIYNFHVTEEGGSCGLHGLWTVTSNETVIKPDNSVLPLVKDEFGATMEWLKNYGGPKGTGLLQLYMPAYEARPDLSSIISSIEYGINW